MGVMDPKVNNTYLCFIPKCSNASNLEKKIKLNNDNNIFVRERKTNLSLNINASFSISPLFSGMTITQICNSIPSKPPGSLDIYMSIDTPSKLSYSDIIKEQLHSSDLSSSKIDLTQLNSTINLELQGKEIQLSSKKKSRLYAPWKLSVIIKLVEKKLNHFYLKKKLIDL